MKQPYHTFEAYLDDNLSAEERLAFEQQLQADPDLKKQFDEFAALRRHYQDSFANEPADAKLKETLHDLGQEFFPPVAVPAQRSRRISRIWYLAPALAAACALLLLLFYRPKDLFDQYYQAPLAAFTEKGDGSAQLYSLAEKAFNAREYATAGQYLDSILAANPGDLQASFYRGLCHLETGDTPAARSMLEPLAQGASAFAEDARWFLALSYLQEKDYAASLSELEKIPQESRWREKADELKRKLGE